MRLAIDASRSTVARVTGTERYALELIRALIRRNHTHTLDLYFRDAPADDLFLPNPHVRQRVIPFPRLWTHLGFAGALWADRPNLTFVPAHTLPFVFPGRALVTVHDLGYRYFPQAHPLHQRLYLDLTTRYSAARATAILADSAATKRDLTRFYDTSPDKIHVAYPGVDAPPVGDIGAVRRKYGLPERYWLYIGTLQPRKNISTIVAAYQRWKARNPHDNAALVLAGGRGWLYDPAWTRGVDGVIETGYVDEADKGALYAGALALLFPSLYEGFGFPVAEALHCGIPVICSDSSSLPEVGGDAAYYIHLPHEALQPDIGVDLLDIFAHMGDEMSAYMDQIAQEGYLASRRERGKAHAARYTWDAAAAQVLAILDALDDD
jgi:glycosyltransferase involved in cell wall biosynthesis